MKADIRVVSVTCDVYSGTVVMIGKLQSGAVSYNPGDVVSLTDESQPGVIAEALAEHLPTLQADVQPPDENTPAQLNEPDTPPATPSMSRWT